jgi:hypothetical protein
MAFNFSRNAQPVEGEAKKTDPKKQMIILLLLVALCGYLYFFTGIMRPKSDEKPVTQAEVVSPAMVKQPIPKRGAGGADAEEQLAEPAKPAPAAPVPVAKPTPAPPAPVAKPAPSKPAPAPTPPPVAKAAAPAPKPVPVKAAVPPKPVAQPAPAPVAKPAAKPVVPAGTDVQAKATGKFTLLVGEFPVGKMLKEIKATIKKAGVAPIHVKISKVTKQMHRLVVGEYAEHDQALGEVHKLKKNGVDAFMGEVGDKYIVYAGSYLYADRAEIERDRLQKLGMNATIARSESTVQLAKVTAGTFATAEKAQAAVDKMKEKGLTTDVVELGK